MELKLLMTTNIQTLEVSMKFVKIILDKKELKIQIYALDEMKKKDNMIQDTDSCQTKIFQQSMKKKIKDEC